VAAAPPFVFCGGGSLFERLLEVQTIMQLAGSLIAVRISRCTGRSVKAAFAARIVLQCFAFANLSWGSFQSHRI